MDDAGPWLGRSENGRAAEIVVDETFIRYFLTEVSSAVAASGAHGGDARHGALLALSVEVDLDAENDEGETQADERGDEDTTQRCQGDTVRVIQYGALSS